MTSEKVIRVELDVPHECAFYKADSFNRLSTYPMPPVTTIRGLIYAALGRPSLLNQDRKPYRISKDIVDKEREFRENFQEKTDISVQIKDRGIIDSNLRTRMKLGRSDDDNKYKTYVAQSETILYPTYIAYIKSDDSELFESIYDALKNPERPLYLGRSDDIVDIKSITKHNYKQSTTPSEVKIYTKGAGGENMVMLPIKSDFKSTYSTKPSQSKLISEKSNIECFEIEFKNKKEYFDFF